MALLPVLLIASAALPQHSRSHSQPSAPLECPSSASSSDCQTFFGEAAQLGNGTIRSWVKLNLDGQPSSVGVTFTEAALTGLPVRNPEGQHGWEYNLALPPQAAKTPFNHIGINWNPQGHEPEPIYGIGHFDFHFYMISQTERAAITLEDDGMAKFKKLPSAEFAPPDYFYAPGSEVPQMGAHWVNQNAHEFHGHAFTTTFIFGSYDGRFIFWEPMITKSFLESKPNWLEAIKQPAQFEKPAYYPTHYRVSYDAQRKEYSVVLEGLTLR